MKSISLYLIIMVCLCVPAVQAQTGFGTQSISIFKNQTAFFMKKGKVPSTNGVYQLKKKDIPSALFGTFWFISPEGKLKHLKTVKEQVAHQEDATQMSSLLKANIGQAMSCHVKTGNSIEVFNGKVLSVSPQELVIMEVESNSNKSWKSFYASNVANISFNQAPKMSLETKEEEYLIEVAFSDKAPQQELELMYLEEGISWSPNYLIELLSETKARLTLRAEVRNDAEDIIDAPVNFVVGVPNFNYADKLSNMVSFLESNKPDPYYSNDFSNAAFSQQIGYADRRSARDITGPGLIEDTNKDNSNEDLYFYSVKNMSLPKGARGQFPIFNSEIDIEHLYEVNLSSNSTSSSYYQKSYQFSSSESNQVFHSIKVPNSTSYPWTTGTALVMNSTGKLSKPISQDLLKYTPPTGTTFVKLTVAPDVRVLDAEKELKRENQKVKWRDGYSYDLVTVEGQVQLKNYKDKEIKLSIVRNVSGETKSSDLPWKTVEKVNVSSHINKSTEICWDLTLKAGEERTITYTYNVYVRY